MSTKIPGLEAGSFEPPSKPKMRMNWSVFGETKTGKTSFPLMGEGGGPIVVFDLDRRLERVVDQYTDSKEIVIFNVKFPKVDPMSRKKDDEVRKEANAEWDRFLKHYDMCLQSSNKPGGVRRISIDTATELFDLRLMAEFGRLMGINPRDRGGANAEFTEVMRRPEQHNASVVWLHHSKPEWKNYVDDQGKEKSTTTGNIILDGFNKANQVAQNVVRTQYNDAEKDPRKRFEVYVFRGGTNSIVNNTKFTSMDWAVYEDGAAKTDPPVINYGPLAYISSLIVPDTEPSDWL